MKKRFTDEQIIQMIKEQDDLGEICSERKLRANVPDAALRTNGCYHERAKNVISFFTKTTSCRDCGSGLYMKQ